MWAVLTIVPKIFISEIRKAGLYNQISQAYAALDPSRAVGVMGDKRVYGYVCPRFGPAVTTVLTFDRLSSFAP